MIISIASFPGLVRESVRQALSASGSDPYPLLMDRQETEQPNWIRRFPAQEDSGYLLFSGVDPGARHSVVKLIRISDGATVAKWDPDWAGIYQKITDKKFVPKGTPFESRAVHPILLADGDIVFNNGNFMARMGACDRQPVWVLDEVMHHSNELAATDSIWAPSVSGDGLSDNPWLRDRVRDDALARVSLGGQLLERQSFARILRDNGLQAMLLGTFGLHLNVDPIHLNQISVAPRDAKYWNRGDLLISARHLSTIFLYRPSTGKILWYQTGPWMNQHSVDFVDDHRISVFSNNVVSAIPKEHAFMSKEETNRVFLYDFEKGSVSEPYAKLLAEARPLTITEGRAQVLADGGLFIEETNYGRHLRFSRDRLLWSRVNDYDEKRIGMVSWSRYLTADEAKQPLEALAKRKCAVVATTR